MPEPESRGVGGTLRAKLGPLPTWAWLAIVTVLLLGYWLYTQHKQGAQQQPQQPSGGQPGVVVINQEEPGPEGGGTPPGPPIKWFGTAGGKRPPKPPEESQAIQITRNETLGDLARQQHWSQATLREVEEMNVTQGQAGWGRKTKLRKGETILRPIKD